MTAPAVWQSCLRGVYDVFAELLRNLRSWLLVFLCASTQSPITQAHSFGVGKPIHPSCSAQTLRRVSSLLVVLRKRVLFSKLASVKRIGGSRETPAYFFVYEQVL